MLIKCMFTSHTLLYNWYYFLKSIISKELFSIVNYFVITKCLAEPIMVRKEICFKMAAPTKEACSNVNIRTRNFILY